MLPPIAYIRPDTEDEALHLIAQPGTRIHAGGTDLLGCLHDDVFEADTIVSLSALQQLEGIREDGSGGLRIGSMTKISSVAEDASIQSRYPGLAEAAAAVASPQLRNQGTLGGNLCQRPRCWYFRGDFRCAKKGGDLCYAVGGENRYHAIFGGDPCYIVHPSDTAPMLLALDASIRIVGPAGERPIALEDFFVLPDEDLERETRLEPGELVTEVTLPAPAKNLRSTYRKVRERGSWDFALASLALALEVEDRTVRHARVVLGGVAPMPWRSERAERALEGRSIEPTVIDTAAKAAVADAEPLEQNGYKVLLVEGLVRESLMRFL